MLQLNTSDPNLQYRNGRTVTIMETRTTDASDPGDTIHRVRFADGFEAIVFPEELAKTPTGTAYRDTL